MKTFNIHTSPLEGTNLIEASAGTGKTFTIASLFLRLVIEKEIQAENILVVTFTAAATEELRDRIRNRLKAALAVINRESPQPAEDELLNILSSEYMGDEGAIMRIKSALANFDEAPIFTIHGFCQRMLMENAFESGDFFNAEFITSEYELLREAVEDFWRKNIHAAPRNVSEFMIENNFNPDYLLGLFKKRGIDPFFKIVPDAGKADAPLLEDALQRLNDFYESVSAEWSLSRTKIEDILSGSIKNKILNGRSYQARWLPGLMNGMNEYITLKKPMAEFEKLKSFTAANLKASTNKGHLTPVAKFFDLCNTLAGMRNECNRLGKELLITLKSLLFSSVRQELSRRKSEKSRRSFDDILINMHAALDGNWTSDLARAVRSRYRAALIDEFQDTDPVQYNIFTTIFGGPGSILYLIGDPKQAIYAFRGADIFAYMDACRHVQERYTLEINRRSDDRLVHAVNSVFSRIKNPFVFKEIEFKPVRGRSEKSGDELLIDGRRESPLCIWFTGNEKIAKQKAADLAAQATAAEISRLVKLGQEGRAMIGNAALTQGDIAVLVRKNRQAHLVQERLQGLSIPCVIYSAGSIFHSQEALDILRVMDAILQPWNEEKIKAALAGCIFSYSGDSLFALISDEGLWTKRLNSFYEYNEMWLKTGFMRMFRTLLDKENVRERILLFVDGERTITNILHVAEVLHSASLEMGLGPAALVKWLHEKRIRPEEGADEEEIRLETDERAVKIITIHRSKGLEYPVVFCPFLWDQSTKKEPEFSFHDPERDFRLTLDLGSGNEENYERALLEELAENMRLFYVALTRARHRTYVLWGKINKTEGSAPAYIFNYKEEISGPDLISDLRRQVKDKSPDEMFRELKAIADGSDGAVAFSHIPAPDGGIYHPRIFSKSFECRKFNGLIKKDWRVLSYSSLISGMNVEAAHKDRDYDSRHFSDDRPGDTAADNGIFNFPAGSRAGSCIHSIFEHIDFTSCDGTAEDIIRNTLSGYGFDGSLSGTLYDMVCRVLDTPLLNERPDLKLRTVSNDRRLNELEFFFPLDRFEPEKFGEILSLHGEGHLQKEFSAGMKLPGFSPLRGFMRGFIDMVFQSNDRFYIIDWKSNLLGSSIEYYSKDMIETAMTDHLYLLQYHLYAVALHQYLGQRLNGYDYERHFGGVFYIFVRGVDPEYGPEFGIFKDRPKQSLIRELSDYLIGPRGGNPDE